MPKPIFIKSILIIVNVVIILAITSYLKSIDSIIEKIIIINVIKIIKFIIILEEKTLMLDSNTMDQQKNLFFLNLEITWIEVELNQDLLLIHFMLLIAYNPCRFAL